MHIFKILTIAGGTCVKCGAYSPTSKCVECGGELTFDPEERRKISLWKEWQQWNAALKGLSEEEKIEYIRVLNKQGSIFFYEEGMSSFSEEEIGVREYNRPTQEMDTQ